MVLSSFNSCCSGIAKKKLISMERASHAQRLDVLLRVLLIIQQLLQENKHASKRDIYYMHPTIFTDQETVDRAINDICSFFRCSRHDLNVGRGYPDVSTRRFLRLLIDELHLPAYCLVDCDPYGFEILMTYRFGSMQMAFDAKSLCIPELRAIGTFPSDLRTYHLPDRCLLPLTPRGEAGNFNISSPCFYELYVRTAYDGVVFNCFR
ncbi:Meiotic recombination protein [Nymphaea thermarum]|nr:Meiotic recombination protein [Nymphaea thermarum]